LLDVLTNSSRAVDEFHRLTRPLIVISSLVIVKFVFCASEAWRGEIHNAFSGTRLTIEVSGIEVSGRVDVDQHS
jgi:hypothetical protein